MNRKLALTVVTLTLIASSLACNMPSKTAATPAGPAAPTDAGFAAPTQEGAPAETQPAGSGSEGTPAAPAATSAPASNKKPADPAITLATTSYLAGTDLFNQLMADFRKRTGYIVTVEAGAPGRGFRLAEKFVVDALLVDEPGTEKDFMGRGLGRDRSEIFHADYVILGPVADPAKIKGSANAVEALKKIATAQAKFITRGDESNASALEKRLWKQAGLTPAGSWYVTSDQGTVGVINVAAYSDAYILAPRELFYEYKSKREDPRIDILFEGDAALLDVYNLLTVNPDKSPKLNYAGAQALLQYLTSPEAQSLIAAYGTQQYGQPVFFVR